MRRTLIRLGLLVAVVTAAFIPTPVAADHGDGLIHDAPDGWIGTVHRVDTYSYSDEALGATYVYRMDWTATINGAGQPIRAAGTFFQDITYVSEVFGVGTCHGHDRLEASFNEELLAPFRIVKDFTGGAPLEVGEEADYSLWDAMRFNFVVDGESTRSGPFPCANSHDTFQQTFSEFAAFGGHSEAGWTVLDDFDEIKDESVNRTTRTTWNLTKPGAAAQILVAKQTVPDGNAQLFDFSGGVSGAIADGGQLAQYVEPGTYTATEAEVAGWSVQSIACDDADSSGDAGTRTATYQISAGETTTCTFVNALDSAGRIVIRKETDPDGSDQLFSFSGAVSAQLGDGDEVAVDVLPGTYLVTEAATEGWAIAALTCDDSDSLGDVLTGVATINVGAGEQVRCTYSNSAGVLAYAANYDHTVFFSPKKTSVSLVAQNYGVTISGPGAASRVDTICMVDEWEFIPKGQLASSVPFALSQNGAFTDTEWFIDNYEFLFGIPFFLRRIETAAICQSGPVFTFSDNWYAAFDQPGKAVELQTVWHDVVFNVYLDDCSAPIQVNLPSDSAKRKGVKAGDLDEATSGTLSCP